MALSGLHVVAGFGGGDGYANSIQSLFSNAQWSETMATATTTTNVAPKADDQSGKPIFRITASADSWVSVGTAPNATSGTRFYVQAFATEDIYVSPGDKLAWIVA